MSIGPRVNHVWRWGSWAIWGLAAVTVAVLVAVFLNTVLSGRIPLPVLARGWAGSVTLMITTSLVTAWWLIFGWLLARDGRALTSSRNILAFIPLLFGLLLPLSAIYLSDHANHYFHVWMIERSQPRGLAILVSILCFSAVLQAVVLEWKDGTSLTRAVGRGAGRVAEPVLVVLLALVGTLQGSAYVGVLDNDSMRYWVIADAILTGVPYPAWPTYPEFVTGGMTPYTIDMPLFPVLLALSFLLFGHTAAASYLPRVVSNSLLPVFTYLFFRTVVPSRPIALALTSLVVLFPPFRFYTLNWPGSDATFMAALMATCWLAGEVVRGERRTWVLATLGFLLAVTALGRPEGMSYAGVLLLSTVCTRMPIRNKALVALPFALPVIAFSVVMFSTFGMPWPRNFNGTIAVGNVLANWETVSSGGALSIFAAGLRLSETQLILSTAILTLLAMAGSWPWIYRHPLHSLVMLPAWLNIASVLAVDPLVSGARMWYDFFRHLSYAIPFLVLAAAVLLYRLATIPRRLELRNLGLVVLCAVLASGVAWNVHYLTKPSLNFGGGSGNLLGAGRTNYFDVIANRYELPVLEFELVDGYYVATKPAEFIASYPDPIKEHFRPFDAVRQTSGTPYQTGSWILFLAGLAISAASTVGGGPAADRGEVKLTWRLRNS